MKIVNKIAAVAALSFAPMAASASTELLTNGGFETGDLSGWTCTGADVCGTESADARTGSFLLRGFDNSGFATLSQTISTTMGETYDFSFWAFSSQGRPANLVGYSLDGTATTGLSTTASFSQYMDSFVASGSSAVISLFFETDPGTGTVRFDDISVVGTAAAVPLPAGLPLLLLGLGGLGVASRRKKAA